MRKDLEKYDKLITAFLVIIAFILGIGWWFAEEKSEPVYLNKIDKLMFARENKSPAFVLTLPDKLKAQEKSKLDEVDVDAVVKEEPADDVVEEVFSLEKLFADIPNIHALPNKAPTISLNQVAFDEELTEKPKDQKLANANRLLPKTSEKGNRPWIVYGGSAKVEPNFKKIAVVIAGVGFDANLANKMAKTLNSEISFSFTPYATNPKDNIPSARDAGHETYVDMLLSSKDFLKEDSGPLSMTLNLTIEESIERLNETLATPAPIGGVVIRDGVASEANRIILSSLLSEIKNRGLLMIDATLSDMVSKINVEGLPRRKADIVIHKDLPKDSIEALLKAAENIAFDKGQVLIVVDPKPIIVMAIYNWVKTFSPQVSYEEAKTTDITKPFALVPASNLVVE